MLMFNAISPSRSKLIDFWELENLEFQNFRILDTYNGEVVCIIFFISEPQIYSHIQCVGTRRFNQRYSVHAKSERFSCPLLLNFLSGNSTTFCPCTQDKLVTPPTLLTSQNSSNPHTIAKNVLLYACVLSGTNHCYLCDILYLLT